MEKICTKCKDSKELKEFNKNKTRKDGHNNICRSCSNNVSKTYYSGNIEKHNKSVRSRSKTIIAENRKKFFKILCESSCTDCGLKNPIVLEFDHKDNVVKTATVSRMVTGGYKWNTILEEMVKCDVRCANCHRIRTAKQFNWYQDLLAI